jgi:large subunit ribosomal protein L15
MRLGAIRPSAGATRPKKRRGKGAGTGLGGTAGKGHKGHKARAGGKIPASFEGGQMPIQRRLPKRGFHNVHRVEYQVVQLGRLAKAEAGAVVDLPWLKRARLVRGARPVKLLSGGDFKVALTVRVDAASESARKAVEAAGGKVETPPKPVEGARAAKSRESGKAKA